MSSSAFICVHLRSSVANPSLGGKGLALVTLAIIVIRFRSTYRTKVNVLQSERPEILAGMNPVVAARKPN